MTPFFVMESYKRQWYPKGKKPLLIRQYGQKNPINTRRALLASIYVMELYKRQWYKKGTLLGGSGGGVLPPFYPLLPPPGGGLWGGILGVKSPETMNFVM